MLKATNSIVFSTVDLIPNQAPLKLILNRVKFIQNCMDNRQWYTVLGVTRYSCNALRNIITFSS